MIERPSRPVRALLAAAIGASLTPAAGCGSTDEGSSSNSGGGGGRTLFVFAALICHMCSTLVWTYGTLRASRSIHAQLLDSVLGSTFR